MAAILARHSGFLVGLTISCLLLQILFLGNLSYIYGTQFQESKRVHNIELLYVDYDGGVIGRSVMDAYRLLEGNSFPTFRQSSSDYFSTPADIRNAVCKGNYWGAVYAVPGGSDSLSTALANGSSAPNTLAYVWNGVRYPAFTQSTVYSSILTLIQTTRTTYYANNATNTGLLNETTLKAFLDPIHATEFNIKAADQGTRVLYNTVSMIMPIIMQFFFMMALNSISQQNNIFAAVSWRANGLVRMCISIVYTFISSLCMVGYIWGFKESWDVNGNQFVLSWMVIWLYMHLNFALFDILTTFIPTQFLPFCVLTWAILNVSSTISPFELNPGFYHWGYALPAHELYQVLGQIWSDGCNNQLRHALPVLFSWWIVGATVAAYAAYYRCKAARSLQGKT